MVDPIYAVKCLQRGFERYKRYSKIDAEIKVSNSTVSFYVKKPSMEKGRNARVSNHHPNIQNFANPNDKPWLSENISIEFIQPKSKADKKTYKSRVYQNAEGTIQPFDVTTFQYNSDILEHADISCIFNGVIRFLNGEGYTDPFRGTPKAAKVISRHSHIKPYKHKSILSTNITVDKNGNNQPSYGPGADYVTESYIYSGTYKSPHVKTDMHPIRLTESDFLNIISESVKQVLREIYYNED